MRVGFGPPFAHEVLKMHLQNGCWKDPIIISVLRLKGVVSYPDLTRNLTVIDPYKVYNL